MEKLQELQNKLNKIQEEINKLLIDDSKWFPKRNELYWYVKATGKVSFYHNTFDNTDEDLVDYGNFYKTESQAKVIAENRKTYKQLKDLAKELNNGEKINWENGNQPKYYLFFNSYQESIQGDSVYYYRQIGQIYCLKVNFHDIAMQRIGEKKLIQLFMRGLL